jgi:phosphatidylinositol dimannoside acyltransferase
VSSRDRPLEAPHRRVEGGSRSLERAAVVAYRATSWVVGHVPPAIPRAIIARGAQISYLLWPTKRRWSNANFGHVLGLPPGDPRVRSTALAAYREYARYMVEMMRLPRLRPELAAHLIPDIDLDQVEPIWRSSEGGLIFALGHVGNPEACGAGIASRGWPISVLADDSAFPEMFEEFKRSREQWGAKVIPWRNLREIYAVLRRREMLALLVDWGYRADGIPVKLFDAWTSLPAGPATLAAKTRSRILPVAIRRQPDGRTFHIAFADPIDVPSAAPADLLRATQQMADALGASIGAAPEQWYSFKPIWPSDPTESARLERRAAEMAAQAT